MRPIAAGVGVAGGRMGFATFFFLGVEGPVSLLFGESTWALFRFLLVLATFWGASGAASTLMVGVDAIRRADLLDDILIDLDEEGD